MSELFRTYPDEALMQHFYPAFGGASNKQIKDLIINENGQLKTVDATWWFECSEQDGKLIVDNTRTTFNARNLVSPYWKNAIRHHRGIVLATALGEGKVVAGKKHQFLMEGERPILLGAIYRQYPNNLYSTAIITREEHPRFNEYHDKAFPLFLPPDPQLLKLWLSSEPETHPVIADLLANPKIFTSMKITRVKTFKDAVAIGEAIVLSADD
jgi:putative SOS response-associated peptidase YedK